MDQLIFGIPALVFLLASGLVLGIFWVWNNKLSPRARALAQRINEFTQESSEFINAGKVQQKAYEADFIDWLAKHLPYYESLESLIVRAGIERTPLQIILIAAGLFFMSLLFLLTTSFSFFIILFVALILASAPFMWLSFMEYKRAIRFEEQLPEALDFIARALKAGHGISAAISMVGEELPAPAGIEFKTTSDQINLGLSFSDALANLANRVRSNDLNFLVTSLVIQRDTGGNLSELLGLISKTIRERLKLKGKVRILASEGKISGWILTLMPFGLGFILYLIKPDYIAHLWNTPAGLHMLSAGAVMIPIGILWMWKIVNIKV